MVITKRNEKMQQSKVSSKHSEENSVFRGEVSYLITYSIFGGGREKGGGVEVVAYLSLSGRGREVGCGWALNRGWVLINFYCF